MHAGFQIYPSEINSPVGHNAQYVGENSGLIFHSLMKNAAIEGTAPPYQTNLGPKTDTQVLSDSRVAEG